MHSVPDRTTNEQKQKKHETKINRSHPTTDKKIIWDKREKKTISLCKFMDHPHAESTEYSEQEHLCLHQAVSILCTNQLSKGNKITAWRRVSLKMNHAGNHGVKGSLIRVIKPLLHLSSKKTERRLGKFAGMRNICICAAFVYMHIYLYICI